MNTRVGALEPTIQANEFVLVEPAGAHRLRFSWYTGRGVVDEPETAGRRTSIVMLGLHAPAIGCVDVAADVIGHRATAPLVDRADDLDDLVGLDVARQPISAKRVRDLIQALLRLLP